MAKDDLTTVDCTNVLRGGIVEPGEWEKGSWRYRVHAQRMWVVVAECGLPTVTLVGIEVSRCTHCGEHEAVIPKIE